MYLLDCGQRTVAVLFTVVNSRNGLGLHNWAIFLCIYIYIYNGIIPCTVFCICQYVIGIFSRQYISIHSIFCYILWSLFVPYISDLYKWFFFYLNPCRRPFLPSYLPLSELLPVSLSSFFLCFIEVFSYIYEHDSFLKNWLKILTLDPSP